MIKKELSRLCKNSLIYGIGGALNRFIGLLLLPFFTRVLSPEDYGIVALLSLLVVLMSGVLSLGTANSIGLLYYNEGDLSKRPVIVWSNFCLMVANGCFWYAIICFFAPSLSVLMFDTAEFSNLIRLAFLTAILSTITDPWLALLRMEERALKYFVLTVSGAIVNALVSCFLVLVLDWSVRGLLLAGTIGSVIMLLTVWFFVGRKVKFSVNPKLLIPLVRIGFPSIFGLFAFLIIDYSDRLMIKYFLNLSDLGIYTVGYSFGMVMVIFMNAFGTAWSPFFMSYVTKPDEAREVFGRVLTYYILGFGSISVLFFLLAKPMLSLTTAPEFHDAWIVVGLVALGYMIKGCYLIFLPGIYFAKKLGLQSILEWIAAVLNIVLNISLIPSFGILGAAFATFLSYLSLPILAWFTARKYLVVNYEWSRIATGSFFILASSYLLYQFSQIFVSELLKLMLFGSLVCVVFFGAVFCFLLKDGERLIIYRKMKP